MTLGMAYYNSSMAVWEPIIEPNEHEKSNGLSVYGPWELNFNLKIEKNLDDSTGQGRSEFDRIVSSSLTALSCHSSRTENKNLGFVVRYVRNVRHKNVSRRSTRSWQCILAGHSTGRVTQTGYCSAVHCRKRYRLWYYVESQTGSIFLAQFTSSNRCWQRRNRSRFQVIE